MMKKVFVEPEIKRIELNMKENIANSGTGDGQEIFESGLRLYSTRATMETCLVQDTGKVMHDVTVMEALQAGCLVMINTRSLGGIVVPLKEVLPYMKG